MKNRISEYDAGDWLGLLVKQNLIDYGEPVVAAYEAMRAHPEICKFEDDTDEVD